MPKRSATYLTKAEHLPRSPGRSRRLEESIEQIGLVYTFKARPKAQDIFDAAFLPAANERGVN